MAGNVISVNVSVEGDISNKINNLVDDTTMTKVHQLLADTVDPWTPFLSGRLHEDITVRPDGVTYNAPYAREKYYGEVYYKGNHPLATSHWVDVAMQTEFDTFANGVKDILVQRAKELYG